MKRPSSAPSVEPGLNPNQPSHRMSTPRPNSGMLWPGIARGLPSAPYLPWRGAEQQQRREGAGRADEVDRRRAGEVLHADVRLQPAAAEDPARGDRVDQRAEDDRVDDVDAELDALERRAPHDGQRDGAEDELEEPLRLDRRVRQAHDREGRLRIAEVAQEEAVGPDDVPERAAEREREPDRPVQEAGDREVGEDLRDDGARVLAAREADLEEGEAGLHEHHETAGDDHPDRVDADGVGQSLARGIEGVGQGSGRREQQRAAALSASARTANERLSMDPPWSSGPGSLSRGASARHSPGVQRSGATVSPRRRNAPHGLPQGEPVRRDVSPCG